MNRTAILISFVVFIVLLQSCNTLYNTSSINIEIMIPGTIKFPQIYRETAVRYNNCNVSMNQNFNKYFEDNDLLTESTNLDSIASEVYFQVFLESLKNQHFFDTVYELESFDYTNTNLNDSLVFLQPELIDSTGTDTINYPNNQAYYLTRFINSFSDKSQIKTESRFIDPEFGLYTKDEIKHIADSTGADMLFSLDYFAVVDGIFTANFREIARDSFNLSGSLFLPSNEAAEVVKILTGWNFYDLKSQEWVYSRIKVDTIKWFIPAYGFREAKRKLPPRKDAVLNAADLAAGTFTRFLVPHWIEVSRMYYRSGNTEFRKTEKMIKEYRWLEAAEIWKKNTKNKNKSIAAKSMFNLALACEINGDLDAATDWAIKSYKVLGSKNEVNSKNCTDYIHILQRRKLDIKRIESDPE